MQIIVSVDTVVPVLQDHPFYKHWWSALGVKSHIWTITFSTKNTMWCKIRTVGSVLRFDFTNGLYFLLEILNNHAKGWCVCRSPNNIWFNGFRDCVEVGETGAQWDMGHTGTFAFSHFQINDDLRWSHHILWNSHTEVLMLYSPT